MTVAITKQCKGDAAFTLHCRRCFVLPLVSSGVCSLTIIHSWGRVLRDITLSAGRDAQLHAVAVGVATRRPPFIVEAKSCDPGGGSTFGGTMRFTFLWFPRIPH